MAIHGQHDTKSLLDAESHLSVLDRYAANETEKSEYQTLYKQIQQVKGELSTLIKEKTNVKRMAELLRMEVTEIEKVAPKQGEVEALIQKRTFLQNARQLRKQANTIMHALYKNEKGVSAFDLVGYAINAITTMGETFPDSEKVIEKLTEFQLEMENISDTAQGLCALCDEDPDGALREIDDRLAAIRVLQKKYGETVEQILKHANEAKEKLLLLEESEGKEITLRDTLEKLVGFA